MSLSESVTDWLFQLQAGEAVAVSKLWQRYFPRMVELARRQLHGVPRRVADEEDVALNAFDSFCRAVDAGRFPDLHDRHGLWQVLLTLTINKAIDLINHSERDKRAWRRTVLFSELAAGRARGSGADVLATVLNQQQPDPAFIALLADRLQWLLHQLEDEQLRSIALLKLEGYTNEEIAREERCALSTVERRLRLIRRRLERHVHQQADYSDGSTGSPNRTFSQTAEVG
jgi:DNA-directed RNA polymerase specialized sigma24 family protein